MDKSHFPHIEEMSRREKNIWLLRLQFNRFK